MEQPRGSNDGDREFVERRLNELDKRRDANLKEKLDAIERYFNLSVTTKSEALNVAISRIQGENKDCASRCANQVKTFYDLIHGLREKDTVKSMIIDSLKLEVVNVKTELNEIHEALDIIQSSVDQHKFDSSAKLTAIGTKIDDQAKDLQRIPLKMIAITSSVVLIILKLVYEIGSKLISMAIKSGGFSI